MVWAGGLDAQYRDALTRSHVVYNRVDVLARDGTVLYSDLPFIDGSVRATLNSRVARVLSLSVDRSWFPLLDNGSFDSDGLLAPFGNRIRAYRGIRYGDGSVAAFPVFYGRIEQVQMSRNGVVSVSGNDLAADVVDAQFETPQSSVTTNTISTEFRRLVQDALGDATFGTSDLTGVKIPPLVWQNDRAQALDDMSATVAMLWYPLADGSFVQRLVPWTNPGQTAQVALADGTGAAPGVNNSTSDWTITVSRTGVYNSVVFASERQDGTAPVYAIVRDTDSTSPTSYLGNFGRKPLLIQNQAALSQSQCLAAAQSALKAATAITQVWDPVSIVPDASLELGDLVDMRADGAASVQAIVGFTLPLRETGDMSLSLRAYAPVTS
jgi:kumamolisin